MLLTFVYATLFPILTTRNIVECQHELMDVYDR